MIAFADDAAARRLAVTEFSRPVAIEAGAGTGKTRTLVSRLGTWLLDAGWRQAHDELAGERAARGDAPPLAAEVAARACDGAVAITFTEAAAAEMAARVDALLAQAANGVRPNDLDALPPLTAEELVARAAALLAASSRLRLSTIHGFCHRLLAEAPLEAGLHPAFEVDAQGERTVELATGVLLARLRSGAPELVELLADGVDPPAALAALAALGAAGVAAEELAGDPFSRAALAPRFAALAKALDRLLAAAAPLAGGHKVRSVLDGLEAIARLRAALVEAEPSASGLGALAGELDACAEEASGILSDWPAGKFGKTVEKIVGAAPAELIAAAADAARTHAALHALDPELTLRARRALAPALAELAARRRVEGVVSFDDLLERAARLLGERAGVRARVRRGIRQLLVDEFQDTDHRQCDLLRALVLAPSEAPAPGLFLVGDPKQSIYGWRSADLAAYAGFLDDLAAAGARFGRLEINFRSQPPILAEVERALAPVLVEERGVQAGFQPLRASADHEGGHGFTIAGRAAVEYWASWDRVALADGARTTASRASEIEAAAIARDVRELVAAGAASWGDFALLLRARGDLDLFLEAFRRAGVPYVVQKDRSYYRRREVIDAAGAVRAILDPGDLLAAVTFLRSPFVGVPDAAWLPLWRAGFPAALIAVDGERGLDAALAAVRTAAAEAPSGLPPAARAPGWELSLAAAVEAIAALRADFRRLPAGAWVERLRVRLLLEPLAAARFLGRFGLANLERFLADLETSLDGEADPGRALSALRQAIAEERPAEEARPPDERADAVAVMTIHTAKGLQFRHVYLAQAQRQPGGAAKHTPPVVALGPPGATREMVLFGAPTPGWPEIEAARQRLAAAEAARLLYVAATRAVDRLVVCGRWDAEPAGAAAEAVPSFADLLAPRLAAAPPLTLEAPARRDEHGVLWRLADDGSAATEIATPAPARLATADRHDAEELARRRDAARRRSARPRFRSASALGAGEPPRAETTPDATLETQRAVARSLGVALHRALELHQFAASDEATWRRLVAAAYTDARGRRGSVDGAAGDLELGALDARLSRLVSTFLWKQLSGIARSPGGVIARELPVLVGIDPADLSPAAPVDGYVGTLDLLYRDAATDELVVADFKSDAVGEGPDVDALVARYRPQLALYGRAVRAGLGLAAPPRLELWLLALDRVVTVTPTVTPAEPAGESG